MKHVERRVYEQTDTRSISDVRVQSMPLVQGTYGYQWRLLDEWQAGCEAFH
jgi:hypothetical protein